jgi:transcriptional regulator GlxA family with amidase domain
LLSGRTHRGYADPLACGNGWGLPSPQTAHEPCVVDNSADAVRSALSLVKRDLGNDVAHEIGERVSPSAKAKVDLLLRDIGHKTIEEKVRASAVWLDENCTRPIAVADAVQVAMMSSRSFSRHFKLHLGVTPSEFLLHARLDLVCRLLTETDLPVEKIARRCGVGNGDRLGKIFRKTLRISPTEYRMRSRIGPP